MTARLPKRRGKTQEAVLRDLLRSRRGQLVETPELVSALYPDPDREPDSADNVVRVVINRLRHAHGCTIETVRGYRLPL